MTDWLPIAIACIGSGGLSAVATAWLTSGASRHGTDRTVDADLQKHWTDTTIGLVEALQGELHTARGELATYRQTEARLAHFEEALDHIHALLAALKSVNEQELVAAERRASAFLRRMRGDDAKGEERQAVQRSVSAERVKHDARRGRKD